MKTNYKRKCLEIDYEKMYSKINAWKLIANKYKI